MSEATTSASTIDLDQLNEVQQLIGAAKMHDALSTFRQELMSTRAMIDHAGGQANENLLTKAHQLASSAGSLGFARLAAANRSVLDSAPGKAGSKANPIALAALRIAIDDALAALDGL